MLPAWRGFTESRRIRISCDAEHRLLLACALATPGADLSAAVASESGAGFSWVRVLESAAANKLRPQLAAGLAGIPMRSEAGRKAMAEIGDASRANTGRATFMAGELVRVLDALRAASIPCVPFKGPAFAALMGDDLGSREMADLDILVRPADVLKAATALAALGYKASLPPQALASPWLTQITPELPLRGARDSMLLELHWATSPQWYPAPCKLEDVMGRLTEVTFFGCPIQWPAPEELFLLHVADGMKSCGRGMRWIADVVRILRHHPDLDWDHIRHVAARNGGLNSIRVALAAIDGLSGDLARELDIPALAIALPAQARVLVKEAKRSARPARAVESICVALQSDDLTAGAIAHFRWAMALADRPMHTAGAIICYLSGPTIDDLTAMPPRGESDTGLRLRALRRRLGGLAS